MPFRVDPDPAPKLVAFDHSRFQTDLRAELRRRGRGARSRLTDQAGIARSTVDQLLHGNRVRDLETVLSLCAYLGLPLIRYLVSRAEEPLRLSGRIDHALQIDRDLFRECASMLTGGDARQLSALARIDHHVARRVLLDGECDDSVARRMARLMRVGIEEFHPSWREHIDARRARRAVFVRDGYQPEATLLAAE